MSNQATTTKEFQYDYQGTWIKPAVRIGICTVVFAMAASFAPNLYLYFRYGVFPSWNVALSAWGQIAMIFGAFYVVEPLSYFPIFGTVGTYIGILSGNISNVRLPASATAQAVVGVENGSKQGEIISVLGICGSVITNLFFLTLSVAFGTVILNMLPPVVPVILTKYILPTVFGACFGQFALSDPKLAVVAMPLCVLIALTGIPDWLVIMISIFGTILIGRVLYKKGILEKKEK